MIIALFACTKNVEQSVYNERTTETMTPSPSEKRKVYKMKPKPLVLSK